MLMIFCIIILLIIIAIVSVAIKPRHKKMLKDMLSALLNNSRHYSVQDSMETDMRNIKDSLVAQEARIDSLETCLRQKEQEIGKLKELLRQALENQSAQYEKPKAYDIADNGDATGSHQPHVQSRQYPCFYYATAPSKVSPVRFSEESLSETCDEHYYMIKMHDAKNAELLLSGNVEACRKLLSNISYTSGCIEVLDKCQGMPTRILMVRPGRLQMVNGYWTLTEKLQIKIL